MKQKFRLTESQLHNMIKKCINEALEDDYNDKAYDCNGVEIKTGDIVVWTDPDGGRKVKYEVFGEPNSEMVKLWSKYGECEALPEECRVIKHNSK